MAGDQKGEIVFRLSVPHCPDQFSSFPSSDGLLDVPLLLPLMRKMNSLSQSYWLLEELACAIPSPDKSSHISGHPGRKQFCQDRNCQYRYH